MTETHTPFPLVARMMRSLAGSGVYVAIAFVGAGTLAWPRGIAYAGLFVAASLTGTLLLALYNPDLLAARKKTLKRDTKPFDRLFYALFLPLVILHPLIAGLDAVRFGWAPLPLSLLVPGVMLFALSSALGTWTLLVNAHAEASVRVGAEGEHHLVTAGPYRVVRHPMYLGTLIGLPGLALITGSGIALVPAALIGILFVWRTGREDATLKAELAGYADYAAATRFRLLPGVW